MARPLPAPIRTRMSYGPRDEAVYPSDDDTALGEALLQRVEQSCVDGKLPRPVVLAFRGEVLERFDLPPVARSGADVHRFIGAVAGQEGVECVAVAGTLGLRRGGKDSGPGLVVFLEWPDNRWWSAVRPVPRRELDEAMPSVRRHADEGYPRPGGLGGWWSRSRFEGLKLRPVQQTVH
jgi:hypothetical protein